MVHPALAEAAADTPLCASGVVLKLAEALHAAGGHDLARANDDLDLAALATVCDLVPLRDENRRIVREGLAALARTAKPGLRALMAVAGVEASEVDERALGFRLGPRLNAAGRMRRADAALELLLTEDGGRAEEVARELDLLNRDRQEAETRILFAADAACLPQAAAAAMVVAGEGWHPGVVGIVASRLVERWRRPCVVVALDGDSGRGSGRSIAPYDLHAGLAACSGHLERFGGHKMAAGVELAADAVRPFRAALSAHAGAELAPEDLRPVERVDAVVPGGLLGLELAEELECLRPFGMGNPQPTLLVPAARFSQVAAMGEGGEHSRFTLVTAGGARSRGVAFRSPPRDLAPAQAESHDIALRLESNRWNGMVEPRVVLRALCPTRPGELQVLGEERPFWERVGRALAAAAPPGRLGTGPVPLDRRGEGFAGVAGDLFSSGEPVLVAVTDVSRRRAGLESLVAGLAEGGMAVASWDILAAGPALLDGFTQLVALDPPPGGLSDPLLRSGPRAHLAWGPAEADFTLLFWRAELDLRPALAGAYRALRGLDPGAGPVRVETALRGPGRHPRTPESCARLLGVLIDLGLIELAADGACRILEAGPTDLERSERYRGARRRLEEIERALATEAPRRAVERRAA